MDDIGRAGIDETQMPYVIVHIGGRIHNRLKHGTGK